MQVDPLATLGGLEVLVDPAQVMGERADDAVSASANRSAPTTADSRVRPSGPNRARSSASLDLPASPRWAYAVPNHFSYGA